jgi:hypothetical protein
LILSIFRHFNIIKIVTHLEVTPQNVKEPKTGRNSGHVQNSDKYGTFEVCLGLDEDARIPESVVDAGCFVHHGAHVFGLQQYFS